MTIYHQFKDNDEDGSILDDHLCNFMECNNCKLDNVCTSSGSDRLQEAIKLCPSILTNFPELGL